MLQIQLILEYAFSVFFLINYMQAIRVFWLSNEDATASAGKAKQRSEFEA